MTNNPVKIIDTYENQDTKNILRGNKLLEYDEHVIMKVINFYMNNIKTSNNLVSKDKVKEMIEYLRDILKNKQYNYDHLTRMIGCKSEECVMGYLLLAFQDYDSELLVRVLNIYGRPMKFNYKNEWFDNFRITALCQNFNLIMYKNYDTNDIYTIEKEYKNDINNDIQLSENECELCIKFIIGVFRAFLIKHNLLQNEWNNEKKILINEDKINNYTNQEICDIAYKYFPFFALTCNGCDGFDNNYTASIEIISKFQKRYPSSMIGTVVNTETYKSGKGKHWVSLFFYKGVCNLICSQGSNFSCFNDNGELKQQLESNGYALKYNIKTIQYDDCNCGIYSVLSLFSMICKDGNILEAVDFIGENANNFGKKFGINSDIFKIKKTVVGF